MTEDTNHSLGWTEEQHQRALFRWAGEEIAKGRESLRLLGAIPNGIGMLRWPALKNCDALGIRLGMPDVYFLQPRGVWHGLFIELKSRKPTAKTSGVQWQMLRLLEKSGYRAVVCRGFEEAVRTINDYEGRRE
jgi:hypothetical protein